MHSLLTLSHNVYFVFDAVDRKRNMTVMSIFRKQNDFCFDTKSCSFCNVDWEETSGAESHC